MTDFFAKLRRRHICGAGAIGALIVCLGPQAQTVSAQAQTTTDSIPNFAPDRFTNWRTFSDWGAGRVDGDDYLPPESGPGPVRSHPDYPYIPNDFGGRPDAEANPTYRVADLTNPILTSWAIERMEPWNEMVLTGEKIPFEAQERCYPPGVPAWNIFRRVGGTMTFFVQTPDKVVMIWRGDNQVRHVYLNVPHSESPKPTWYGESVGHYEGNTLVVDTIAILDHPLSFVDHYRTPHSDQLHVVERFTLSGDGNVIEVNIHVEDPVAFTTPWNAVQRLYRSNTGRAIEESSCAELGLSPGGDYFGLQAVSIPQADTPDF